ncbi:MAG: MerR family transcriptional regulator [Dermatophilaceae bacterium]
MDTTTDARQAALSITEVAAETGLSPATLRYYERDGLLVRAVPRSPSGHRRYGPDDLRWLRLLIRLRTTGMSIGDLRGYAAMVREGRGNELDRLELLRAHRRRVLDQLADVTSCLEAIDQKIGDYEDALDRA